MSGFRRSGHIILCSCRKNGLKCVTACGDCRGDGCKNAEQIVAENTDTEGIGISEYTFFHIDYYHIMNIYVYNCLWCNLYCI